MKKILLFLLALLLILSMAIPAFAVTPKLKVPNMPKIPTIKVEVKLPENFWDNWFAKHPINFG